MSDIRPGLHEKIAHAHAAADAIGEARIQAELATAETAMGALPEAIAALDRAAALFQRAGRGVEEARARYGLSLLLSQRARILDGGVGAAVAAQAYPEAARLLNEVVSLRERAGDRDGRLDAIRRLASVSSLMGDPKRAFEILSEGMVDAGAGQAELLRARLELNLLARAARAAGPRQSSAAEPVGVRAEPLSVLVADAVALGDHSAAGYIRLQMAADANLGARPDEAATHAESARQDALRCSDPMLLLLASLAIAEVREKVGDRVGVLTILYTCKAALQKLLGEAAAKPVLDVLLSVEKRWGAEVFEAATVEHRAQGACR